jgi:hypothetical protein
MRAFRGGVGLRNDHGGGVRREDDWAGLGDTSPAGRVADEKGKTATAFHSANFRRCSYGQNCSFLRARPSGLSRGVKTGATDREATQRSAFFLDAFEHHLSSMPSDITARR